MKTKLLNSLMLKNSNDKLIFIYNYANANPDNKAVLLNSFEDVITLLDKNEIPTYLTLLLQLKIPHILKIFKLNFDIILCHLNSNQLMDIIFIVMARDDVEEFLDFSIFDKISGNVSQEQMFQIFFMNLSTREFFLDYLDYLLDNKKKNVETDDIATILLSYQNGDSILRKHFNFILSNSKDILGLQEKMEIEEDLLVRTNEYINAHIDLIIREYINRGFKYIGILDVDDPVFLSILGKIFTELLIAENVNLSDTEMILGGSYSCVYKIGTKVLKIGKKRQVFELKNNKRFLPSILRKELLVKGPDENKFIITLEITEFVNTSNITEDDVYLIFKELRSEGLLWTDPRIDNIGKLNRPNQIFFPGMDSVSHEVQNYYSNEYDILKKGDLVIIDNDYIYPTDYDEVKYGNEYFFNLFESRYQEELKNIKNNSK